MLLASRPSAPSPCPERVASWSPGPMTRASAAAACSTCPWRTGEGPAGARNSSARLRPPPGLAYPAEGSDIIGDGGSGRMRPAAAQALQQSSIALMHRAAPRAQHAQAAPTQWSSCQPLTDFCPSTAWTRRVQRPQATAAAAATVLTRLPCPALPFPCCCPLLPLHRRQSKFPARHARSPIAAAATAAAQERSANKRSKVAASPTHIPRAASNGGRRLSAENAPAGFACPAVAASPKPETLPMPTGLMSRAGRSRSPSPPKDSFFAVSVLAHVHPVAA